MKNLEPIGIQIPQVYLPRSGQDLQKWAVIACDQFTSEPEYWQKVEECVGNASSTYRLILPEVFLGTLGEADRIRTIHQSMNAYLDEQILVPQNGFIYVERRVASGKIRKGLVLCLDLERYDFNKGSQSLIRATEGTILERLPPRIKIREGAPLELPHIIVLIDDPQRTVLEPFAGQKNRLKKLYDFELMMGSGQLQGYLVDDPQLQDKIVTGLEHLADPRTFQHKYGVSPETSVLLFAMGDGNHSLATAKAIWEKLKPQVGLQHPARYALVEIENVHDEALEFEPIHRVLFDVHLDPVAELLKYFGNKAQWFDCQGEAEMVARVDTHSAQSSSIQRFGVVRSTGCGYVEISSPPTNLPVGTLQAFIDQFIRAGGAEKIDYVHGEEVVSRLGSQPGNIGFYLPAMDKSDLFKTVILDGALPRKTFSMGEAKEKRFYMEARRIA